MATVQEIRDQLINEYNLNPEEVNNIKGKSALVEALNTLTSENDIESILTDLEEDTSELEETSEEDIPNYNSLEWSDYVLSKFNEDELIEGNPNINGLRRVTNQLLGEIIKSVPVRVMPTRDGVICSYEVSIAWGLTPNGDSSLVDHGIRVFGGVADSSENNTEAPYSNYLAAMAETRAEVRALRKALRLKGVAHEEVKREDHDIKTTSWDNAESKITPQQLSLIKLKTKSLGICFDKFIKQFSDDENKLTSGNGAFLIQEINQYQTKYKEIPESIKPTKEEKEKEGGN